MPRWEMRIPEVLRNVVAKRLSRLGTGCTQLLTAASVIGRDFSLDTVQQITAMADEALFAALEAAVCVGVLEEHARPGQIRYRFAHAYFRQTLYEAILAPRRQRLHRQVALTLEEEHRTHSAAHAAELAEHYAQAGDGNSLVKAVAYYQMAARWASTVHAYTDATQLVERALDAQELVDPDDHRVRCRLLLAMAEALCCAGEPERAGDEVAEQAFRLAEILEDAPLASESCRIAIEAASRYGSIGAMQRTARRHWAERADRYAPLGSPARVYAELARGLAAVGSGTSSTSSGRIRARGAVELARTLEEPRLLFECAALLIPGAALGTWAEALKLAEEVVDLPRQGVSWWTTAIALGRCAAVFLGCGQRDRAEDLWREVRELGERTRDSSVVAHAIQGEIIFATLDGRLEPALEATGRFRALADQAGISRRGLHLGVAHGMRAYFYLGRAHEALDGLRQEAEAAPGPGMIALGLGLAHAGHTDEARSILDNIIELWRRTPPDGEADTRRVQPLLELGVLLEDRAAVTFLLPLLAPAASIVSTQMDVACVARHLGAAAALLGDYQQARSYYEQALRVCEQVRFRPEIALSHLQLAELPLDGRASGRQAPHRGRRRQSEVDALKHEASAHLDFAVAELRLMGMRPALDRALELQSSQRTSADRRPGFAYPGGLSVREVEVLRLVAVGKSNRDIAECLMISPNTATRHVSNILAKVGAANRAEAASYATRHGLV
jgi:DNA-binding CsgD family transcriptional regulator